MLATCLDSLAPSKQTFAQPYEVIVTDDGTDSSSEEMIEQSYSWAHWVAGPRKGPAANRNNGAKAARGEWLAFIDDDCIAEPQWLQEMLNKADAAAADVIEGKTYIPQNRDHPLLEGVENLQGGLFWSCNLAIKRNLFIDMGGFDEDFREAGGEDMELAWRLRERNIPTGFSPNAVVAHPARRIGWQKIWWRTLLIRYLVLFELKTNKSTPLDAPPLQIIWTRLRLTVLDLLRSTYHLFSRFDKQRWRTRLFIQIWKWITFPVVVPYMVYWDLRYHRELRRD